MKTDNQPKLPDSGTRWIMNRLDLPQRYADGRFLVTKADGTSFEVILSKRNRQVLEALMHSPLYCASPIRLSDKVLLLRHEFGINIATTFYDDENGPVTTRYGVYTLVDGVTYLGDVAEKAVAA